MEDVINNKEDRKRFCDSFTGGRMCKVTGLIVPKFFCNKICQGRPEEVQLTPEIKRNIERYQRRGQAVTIQGRSSDLPSDPAPVDSYRAYCLTCPGPSGKHLDEKDTYFKTCGFCLLLGIKTDGSRQRLKDWWELGRACPLGHWPPADQR